MSKLSRVLIFLGTLGLVMAVMALLASRSGSRGALQRYKVELKAKGEKLTYAELTRGRLTNAVDTQAIITNAIAKLGGERLSPGLLLTRRCVQPGRATLAWKQPGPGLIQPVGPGRLGTWAELEAQMQAVEGILRDIRSALKDPARDAGPCTNMLTASRVSVMAIDVTEEWLKVATENDLNHGRLEEALRNLEALAGLAFMERDEYWGPAQFIRCSVAGNSLPVTWEALQAPGWTEPQLERLQKAWERVDLVEALERGFVGSRAHGEEYLAWLRRPGMARRKALYSSARSGRSPNLSQGFEEVGMDYLYFPAYKLASIDADELFFLQTVQEGITGLRLLQTHHPWAEARPLVYQVHTNMSRIWSSALGFRYFVSLQVNPDWTWQQESAIQGECDRQMTLAAIALKRSQMRHGKLPSSLEALVPEFLSAVPWGLHERQTAVLPAEGRRELFALFRWAGREG
jgi:hypothetical protein